MRWGEIAKSAFILGIIKDYSKAECLRLANQLDRLVKEGKVVRESKGHYRRDHLDATPAPTEEPAQG
jgi:hypothetical protein